MFLIYDIFFIAFACLYCPYLLLRRKWHGRFGQRFGRFSSADLDYFGRRKMIWVHAVSVGEVLSTAGILRRIKKDFPGHGLVLSTVTQTGYRMAASIMEGEGRVIYAPLDLHCIVRRYIRAIRPCLYISAETEIWPNLFSSLHTEGVPVILINGRISERSCRGYRLFGFLVRRILGCVRCCLMQTQSDADRITGLGADPRKVHVVGNMKFDDLSTPVRLNRSQIGLDPSHLLIVAGSTHPGEEEIVIRTYNDIREEEGHVRLVVAPRHTERVADIVQTIAAHGLKAKKFSQLQGEDIEPDDVVVVDTIGHLRSIYGLADIVFVGKSLKAGGGHNIIEPAYFAKAIIVGPMMDNFRDITDLFLIDDAVIQAGDADDFRRQVKELVKDSKRRERLGVNARKVIDKNTGATDKTWRCVRELLN